MEEKTKVIRVYNIPESLHRALKIQAAEAGTTMNDLVISILKLVVKANVKNMQGWKQ